MVEEDLPSCTHEKVELRRFRYANGSYHFKNQCLECGKSVGNPLPKAEVPLNVPDADLQLQATYERERTQVYKDRFERRKEERRNDYAAYLASPQWQAIRRKVFERAGGLCEGCGVEKATQVHHLNYERIGRELLFDLVAVCRSCHEQCHPEKTETMDDLPCYGCRHIDWDQEKMLCGKFGLLSTNALAQSGPCGPGATALEPLR